MIGIGRGQKANNIPGADAYIGKNHLQRTKDFVTMLRGKITCLTLWGCEVGKDATNDQCPFFNGDCFLQDLANCLSSPGNPTTVKAYDRTVRARDSFLFFRDAKLFVDVDNNQDTPANHLVSKVGDPAVDCPWD